MTTLKLLTLLLLGVLLGFFLVILLPVVFVAWLNGWLADTWASIVGTPVRCDGGDPSPTEDKCRHGVTPDNCLMCAVEAPDDDPSPAGNTPLAEQIMRDEWVRAVELWLEMKKGKK
jgi:hypothetical protein